MTNLNPTDLVNIRVELTRHNSNSGFDDGKVLYYDECMVKDILYPDMAQYVSPADIGITDTEPGNGIDYILGVYFYNNTPEGEDDYAMAEKWASDYYHGDRDWQLIPLD